MTKDKKPDEKSAGKEAMQIIPPRPDTPEMFKAALKVTQQLGIEGVFSKLKKAYRPSESTAEVRLHFMLLHSTKWETEKQTWTSFCVIMFKFLTL